MSLRIYLRRNSDLARLGVIDQFESLTLEMKFNETSIWTLEAGRDSTQIDQLDSTTGIIVERDGNVILSGSVDSVKQTWNANGNNVEITGSDDSAVLSRRIVFPGTYGVDAFSAAYDVDTAVAETVLHYYVNKNAGPGATGYRQHPGLVMGTNNGAGSSVTGRGRLQNLNELLKELALSGGDLRYQIVQVGSTLEFQVYDPQDLTDSIQFSPSFGNLASFSYEANGPTSNYFYAGGGGEGLARVFRRGGDAPSIATWGLHEDFRDRRDTTDTTEMDQTIIEELATNSETTALAVTPIDGVLFSYGTDYSLGDRVRVIPNDVVTIEDAIRAVTLTYTHTDGEIIEPVIGTPGVVHPRVPAIYRKRKYVEKKTRDLERI